MTAAQLRTRIAEYRAMIAYWQRLLEVGYDDQLVNDIHDLESWISALYGINDCKPVQPRTKRSAATPKG